MQGFLLFRLKCLVTVLAAGVRLTQMLNQQAPANKARRANLALVTPNLQRKVQIRCTHLMMNTVYAKEF